MNQIDPIWGRDSHITSTILMEDWGWVVISSKIMEVQVVIYLWVPIYLIALGTI
jgi:hypothetical protein